MCYLSRINGIISLMYHISVLLRYVLFLEIPGEFIDLIDLIYAQEHWRFSVNKMLKYNNRQTFEYSNDNDVDHGLMCCVQAAYLVGIADPNSQPGRPGLVDQGTFARANQAIQMACQDLTNPASTQKQVGDATV